MNDYQPPDLIPLEFQDGYISGCYLPPDEILMRKEDAMMNPDKRWDHKYDFYRSRELSEIVK